MGLRVVSVNVVPVYNCTLCSVLKPWVLSKPTLCLGVPSLALPDRTICSGLVRCVRSAKAESPGLESEYSLQPSEVAFICLLPF